MVDGEQRIVMYKESHNNESNKIEEFLVDLVDYN
jgi:hypothetical protein